MIIRNEAFTRPGEIPVWLLVQTIHYGPLFKIVGAIPIPTKEFERKEYFIDTAKWLNIETLDIPNRTCTDDTCQYTIRIKVHMVYIGMFPPSIPIEELIEKKEDIAIMEKVRKPRWDKGLTKEEALYVREQLMPGQEVTPNFIQKVLMKYGAPISSIFK